MPERKGPRSPTGPVRRTWGSISREQIVDAAVDLIESHGGYEQLTIRNLAARLGVAPMSLYRHVRDKDDLLDEVVDRLLAEVWRPDSDESDWRGWAAEAAERLRRFLVDQPAALHVYLSHPVVSSTALTRMACMLRVLRAGLGDDQVAGQAYAVLHTYTVGFAALEASRQRSRHPGASLLPGVGDRPKGLGVAAPDESGDLTREIAGYTTSTQFRLGIRYLLEGVCADPGSRPAPPGPVPIQPSSSPA
ncbi:MAG: TetR/AcrR family transcriptional regulator [Acidobacteriota bacterium]|nr:TetR/AcrR family transcriptional regulator [Acidobacteriota bacterium]